MAIRARVARLQKAMRGRLDCIELADGGRYCFEPERASIDLFGYWSSSVLSVYYSTPRPEPPEVLKAVAGAADREKAFRQAYALSPTVWCPVDEDALVERGEFVPRSLVASPLEDPYGF
jgi:hypothetical protein